MESAEAAVILSALAHAGRLEVFRRLVQAGEAGLAAGDIARATNALPNTLSANLNILSQAKLVRARRDGRSIIYAADYAAMAGLLGYLTEDCCGGAPEVCAPLARTLEKTARCASPDPVITPEPLPMPQPLRPFNVLFLCTGNSARSILAEAIMNRAGAGKFRTYSAGSTPKGEVNPHALHLLRKLNFRTADLRSKPWDEFAAPGAPELDFVFTVCDNAAGEVCPVWPGQPMTAHWGIPDPAAVVGSEAQIAVAFAEAFRQLNGRITAFINLPIASLDKLSLQRRLDQIGERSDAMAK